MLHRWLRYLQRDQRLTLRAQFYGYTDSLVKDNLLVCSSTDGGKAKVYSIQDIPPKQLCKKLEEIIEKVVR